MSLFRKITEWIGWNDDLDEEEPSTAVPSSTVGVVSTAVNPPPSATDAAPVKATLTTGTSSTSESISTSGLADSIELLNKRIRGVNLRINHMQIILLAAVLVLMFMLASLIYGYWQFVYDSSRNDDYRYGLSQSINDQKTQIELLQNELSSLKKCLAAGGWNVCLTQ